MSSNARVIGVGGPVAATTESETSHSRGRRNRPGFSTAVGGFYLAAGEACLGVTSAGATGPMPSGPW
jgi:hypothetical protein